MNEPGHDLQLVRQIQEFRVRDIHYFPDHYVEFNTGTLFICLEKLGIDPRREFTGIIEGNLFIVSQPELVFEDKA